MNNRVEIKKIGGIIGHFDLIIDGKRRIGVSVNESLKTKLKTLFTIISKTVKSSHKLSSIPFNQFYLADVEEIVLASWRKLDDFLIDVIIKKHQIKIVFEPDLKNWKQDYSHTFYLEKLFEIISSDEWSKSNDSSVIIVDSRLTMTFPRISGGDKLISINDEIIGQFRKLLIRHNEIVGSYKRTENKTLISVFFGFPDKLKVSCEQYILYFTQFLQDLGINATSNLKEEAGKVLFSVTPTDDVEALDKIREALAVYLNLPASPISDLEYSENFALMRLQQQVRNLQHSQQMAKTEILSARYALGLAQQNIDNQDRMIVRQNSLIKNQTKIIEKITSKSIMMDSVENKEELEEIYEGVKVGESKWLKELTGIALNPAKAINAIIKNTLGKDDGKKSILGLDEES